MIGLIFERVSREAPVLFFGLVLCQLKPDSAQDIVAFDHHADLATSSLEYDLWRRFVLPFLGR